MVCIFHYQKSYFFLIFINGAIPGLFCFTRDLKYGSQVLKQPLCTIVNMDQRQLMNLIIINKGQMFPLQSSK